jgi:hypothetical protein
MSGKEEKETHAAPATHDAGAHPAPKQGAALHKAGQLAGQQAVSNIANSLPLPEWKNYDIARVQSSLGRLGLLPDQYVSETLDAITVNALDGALGPGWRTKSNGDVWCALEDIGRLGETTLATSAHAKGVPAGFGDALSRANAGMASYVAQKAAGVHYHTALGPNLDGTNFYRIGTMGTDGFGMPPDELEKKKAQLEKLGFPRLDEDELRMVNMTDYAARRRASPGVRHAVKHFPGGDETAEATEKVGVHFGDPAATARSVGDFQALIQSGAPPELIMMSHATYDRRGFGLDDKQAAMPAGFGDSKFEDVPASLNPLIVRYLRETLGYKGLVIADWYDMGAIKQFMAAHPELAITGDRSIDIAILATLAGTDYITGVDAAALAKSDAALARAGAKLPPEFSSKLEESMQRIWATLDHRGLSYNGASFTDGEKLFLKSFDPTVTYGEFVYDDFVAAHPDKRAVCDVFHSRAVGANEAMSHKQSGDIWNRTGVLTLIQRQLVVEELTHQKFSPLPRAIVDENRWFNMLMNDAAFRKVYDRIDWSSPEAHAAYASAYERNRSALGEHHQAALPAALQASGDKPGEQ